MSLIETFKKARGEWPSRSINVPYDSFSKNELFELGYLATSEVPFRCFSIKINPDKEHQKDVALLYNAKTKCFVSLLNKDDAHAITVYNQDEALVTDSIKNIEEKINMFKTQLQSKPENLREQIVGCILVERKVDEAMHLSLAKEISRRVYFAIGECRERAALIPIFQNSVGAEIVQLALQKWMNFAFSKPQEEQFPAENTNALVKNFLQIKKWLLDTVTKQLAGINTLREEQTFE